MLKDKQAELKKGKAIKQGNRKSYTWGLYTLDNQGLSNNLFSILVSDNFKDIVYNNKRLIRKV